MKQKFIALVASSVLTMLGQFTLAHSAHAYTMSFDEFGNCSITSGTGTCSASLEPDPTGFVTSQNVLVYTLPSPSTASGQTVGVFDPMGTTLSDVLRFFNSGSGSCSPSVPSCADVIIFYSFDFGAPADVGTIRAKLDASATEDASGEFSFLQGDNTFDGVSQEAAPLPAALPLFATGLGAIGLLGWRRKRKASAGVNQCAT